MEGTRMAEGLTPEQFAQAPRSFEVMKRAVDEDRPGSISPVFR